MVEGNIVSICFTFQHDNNDMICTLLCGETFNDEKFFILEDKEV